MTPCHVWWGYLWSRLKILGCRVTPTLSQSKLHTITFKQSTTLFIVSRVRTRSVLSRTALLSHVILRPTPPFSTSDSRCQLCLPNLTPTSNQLISSNFYIDSSRPAPVSAHWLIGSKCRFKRQQQLSTTQLASPPLFEFEDKLFHWLIGVKCKIYVFKFVILFQL